MKYYGWIDWLWKIISIAVVAFTLISCAKGGGQRTAEEALTLGNSSFNPGEKAPGVESEPQAANSILEQSQNSSLASVSIFSTGATDGGYIPGGPIGSPKGNDTGTIPPPGSGGTTATTLPASNLPASDTTTGSAGGSTTAPSTSEPQQNQPSSSETTTGIANNDSGTVNFGGSGSSTQTGGTDTGFIPGGGTTSGNDSGSIPASGGTTVGGNDNSSNPTSGTTPVAGNDSGNTSTSGGTTIGGNDNGSTPISGGTTVGGVDNGSVPTSGGTTVGGNDNGSVPTSGGTTVGGNDSGNTPTSGVTTDGGNNSGSTPTSGGTSVAGNDSGSTPTSGGTSSGGNDSGNNSNPLPVILCHIPPGNESAAHTIIVDEHALSAHFVHGDKVGSCPTSNVGSNPGNGSSPNTPGAGDEDQSCPCKQPSHPAHGNCHTNERKMVVNLGRVCSMRRSASKDLFFEEAKHPILAIEAIVPKGRIRYGGQSQNPYGNSGVYEQWGVLSVESKTKERYVIATYDLSSIDLINKKHKQEEKFNLTALKKKLGRDWSKAAIVASVCEDINGDGSCFGAEKSQFLSVVPATFKANRIPQQISLDVWSGRGLSQNNNYQSCDKQYSPIVLDLTGEGISLSGAEEGVQFDLNADGNPVYTGWVKSSNNAFLVRDVNGNGAIDDGSELFGSATLLSNGKRAANGFEALKDLDSNHDGLLNRADKEWRNLRLWFDRNFDAYSQRSELERLESYQIQSLNLNYIELLEMDEFGNQTRERSTYTRKIRNKTQPLLMVDVWFRTLLDE